MKNKTMSKKPSVNLSRADKLLLVMLSLSEGKGKSLRFEDIVVRAFKEYPDDFHLRGYLEYPDSGDLVHKPLYEFRKNGLVEASSKIFSLTLRGLSEAEKLKNIIGGREIKKEGRLSGFGEKEISRIEGLEGFQFFLKNETEKILDTDFYAYLGTTVRAQKNDFMGRLNTVNGAVNELESVSNNSTLRSKISQFHKFMLEKFENIINKNSK